MTWKYTDITIRTPQRPSQAPVVENGKITRVESIPVPDLESTRAGPSDGIFGIVMNKGRLGWRIVHIESGTELPGIIPRITRAKQICVRLELEDWFQFGAMKLPEKTALMERVGQIIEDFKKGTGQ